MENLELARAVANQITQHPENVDMADWARRVAPCRTIACLGGETLIQAGYLFDGLSFRHPESGCVITLIGAEARNLLGLTDLEYYWGGVGGCSLFHGCQDAEEAIDNFCALVKAEEERRS